MTSTRIAEIAPLAARVGARNMCLVKITCEDGTVGWGEAGLTGRERAVIGILEHFAPLLVGEDPGRIGHLWQRLYRSQYFEGGRVITAALSAIDLALHDIKGRRLGVPVHDLLGGRQRETVPAFASTAREPDETMIEQARELVSLGWNCIRLSAAQHYTSDVFDPRTSIAETAHWMAAARDALGSPPVLGIDYHHRLSVAEAASFCRKMAPGTLDFLEEPIRAESPAAYRQLRAMTDIPFAIGEEFASKWDAIAYVEGGLTQFLRIDVCVVGGLTEAAKIAGWAEAHYLDLMPHNPLGPLCTAASVHLAAAIPNFAWLECRDTPVESCGFDAPDFFDGAPGLDGACYRIPTRPGLGVEVDEAALRASPAVMAPASPLLTRPDGAVANW